MSGRKGRVSNELVAASCAAVLAVYGAGYWRTRDVARRLETQAQQRRPVHSEPAAVAVEMPAPPAPAPEPPLPMVTAAPAPEIVTPPPAAAVPKPVKKKAPKVAAAPPSPAKPAVPEIQSVPLEPEPAPIAKAAVVPESLPPPAEKWADGTYTGWGQSYHGDIEVRVVIRGGHIVESAIATCATRYPCDVIDKLIDQPVKRQSAEVDTVSRATESADAFYFGLVEALKQAQGQ